MQHLEVQDPALRKLVQALRAYEPERVYLFGSWARGEADETSDLDVVVIKQTEAPFLERIRRVLALLPPELGPVDVLVYTPEEWQAMKARGNAFVETVEAEGRLLYARQAEG